MASDASPKERWDHKTHSPQQAAMLNPRYQRCVGSAEGAALPGGHAFIGSDSPTPPKSRAQPFCSHQPGKHLASLAAWAEFGGTPPIWSRTQGQHRQTDMLSLWHRQLQTPLVPLCATPQSLSTLTDLFLIKPNLERTTSSFSQTSSFFSLDCPFLGVLRSLRIPSCQTWHHPLG